MQLETLIFDPSPCGFPKPRLPLLPVGLDGISFQTVLRWAPAEHFRHFSRGRYALHAAYRLSGLGPGTALLAPAYHCRTMLDAALALGSDIVLYPLNPDLSPDFSALERCAGACATPIKAVLATHFFGFPQDFAKLAEWCSARGITLIEDASHAFLIEQHRPDGMGIYGEFVVSSPYKFLPTPDGGLLYARDPTRLQAISLRRQRWAAELRGVKSLIERKRRMNSLPDTDWMARELANLTAHPTPAAREMRIVASFSGDYRPAQAEYLGLRLSRLLYRHPDIALISRRRRENYARWLAISKTLPHCHPLFPVLPENCIPYMFPLYLAEPEKHFILLKRLGMPIWRWDSLAVSQCQTAQDYRLHLLHLPCHQSLDERQMNWMADILAKTLNMGHGKPEQSIR